VLVQGFPVCAFVNLISFRLALVGVQTNVSGAHDGSLAEEHTARAAFIPARHSNEGFGGVAGDAREVWDCTSTVLQHEGSPPWPCAGFAKKRLLLSFVAFPLRLCAFPSFSGAGLAEILSAGEWRSPAFMSYLDANELEADAVLEAAITEDDSASSASQDSEGEVSDD
jgi:hypothetical protein